MVVRCLGIHLYWLGYIHLTRHSQRFVTELDLNHLFLRSSKKNQFFGEGGSRRIDSIFIPAGGGFFVMSFEPESTADKTVTPAPAKNRSGSAASFGGEAEVHLNLDSCLRGNDKEGEAVRHLYLLSRNELSELIDLALDLKKDPS
jgi:hypothetical protein